MQMNTIYFSMSVFKPQLANRTRLFAIQRVIHSLFVELISESIYLYTRNLSKFPISPAQGVAWQIAQGSSRSKPTRPRILDSSITC